jgi:hypothetical protein
VTESIADELEELDSKPEKLEIGKHKGGFEKSADAWDMILKRYMAGVDPIDEESSGTDDPSNMRTMWIESPCHSRRPSEAFSQGESAAVYETAVDRSVSEVSEDDHVKVDEPHTVDSPTMVDQHPTESLLSRDTDSFTLVAPGSSLDEFESQVRESVDRSESSFVQIDLPTTEVSVPTGLSETASSSLTVRDFLSNRLFGRGRSGQSQAEIRSRL